jgi:hypothetical protein
MASLPHEHCRAAGKRASRDDRFRRFEARYARDRICERPVAA